MVENQRLLLAILCFWSPSFNTFHFNHDMSTPTLLDLGFLLDLQLTGECFSATSNVSIPANNFGLYLCKTTSYSSYIKFYDNWSGPLIHQKLVAFCLVWLYNFLLCYKSVTVVKAYLRLAAALAKNRSIWISPLFC